VRRQSQVTYLDVDTVDGFHDEAIAETGGASGLRDRGLLESAVAAPRQGYYNTLNEVAAAYAHGLAKDHPYVDGNKRTAFTAMVVFLELNDVVLSLSAERDAWIGHFRALASGDLSREELVDLITEAVGGDDELVGDE